MERLQKVLAQAGIASRRQSEELILQGKVKVNGQVVQTLGTKVDPDQDWIEVNGKHIKQEKKRTFVFYKPKLVITSMSDPEGRKTVVDYFDDVPERIYPVGRLDYETEGLLLMTNDGELANRLAHPRYEVNKVYVTTIKGKPTDEELEQLRKGVRLDDGMTAPAEVRMMQANPEKSKLRIQIHEGRNRQIRRMCEVIGYPVLHLIRTKYAFLHLQGLNPGDKRELTKAEIEKLNRMLR
ncbi:23S rRNA pseudouridine2605 synthase [Thermoactinomyces sp. DSM 45891]|uniref:pseudouridine synthase n=1 Tax=Thermoactinomyces sp. DSM 45891 TaxID=1761907 RepID=UPI00090F9180|nr:pseudouridine synthase [Thermoactinomyces sp. DSM 45891]SFX02354.1 23S rRNA pseudouridine2605 synthase [Thermoactinomyces sp. DSM 45891]